MKPQQFELMLPLLVIAMLVWDSQKAPEPKQIKDELFLTDTHPITGNPKQIPITPQQKEWAEKAVRKYAEAQEKKWRNWNEAMFDLKE
jgi:hypothetical protein